MPDLSLLQRSLTWKKKPQKHPPTTIRGLNVGGGGGGGGGEGDTEAERQPPTPGRLGVNTRRRGASTRAYSFHQTIKTSGDESAALPRFGPIHGEDTELNQFIKDVAWRHVLEKEDSRSDRAYLISMAKIEQRAKEIYDPTLAKTFSPLVFRRRMAVDGCLFLQLTLHILGGGDLLGYPETHLYFGKHVDACYWMPAMFHVGNQIPYVVIRSLMKQAFFRDVIRRGDERGTWQQPKQLPKLILYLTVVAPELRRPGPILSMLFPKPPSDVLHALHCLLLETRNAPVCSEIKGFRDLETGREEISKEIRFPSAGELLKSGIVLRKAKGGITDVRFQNLFFCAYLYVPPLTTDRYPGDVLTWLRNYEQTLDESNRQVTSYLRLIKDLAQTYTDIDILQREGIIQVEDVLNEFVTMGNYTLNFRHIRSQITDYGGPPWRLISITLGLFAVIQTIFSVLAYFMPPTSSH